MEREGSAGARGGRGSRWERGAWDEGVSRCSAPARPGPSESHAVPMQLLTPFPCVPFGLLVVGGWALVHIVASNCVCKMTLLRLLTFEEFGFWVWGARCHNTKCFVSGGKTGAIVAGGFVPSGAVLLGKQSRRPQPFPDRTVWCFPSNPTNKQWSVANNRILHFYLLFSLLKTRLSS